MFQTEQKGNLKSHLFSGHVNPNDTSPQLGSQRYRKAMWTDGSEKIVFIRAALCFPVSHTIYF